jgi:ubiquinone/menaquinone biosynthesis C-methylase UbiE
VTQFVADIGCGRGDFHLESMLRSDFRGRMVGVDVDFKSCLIAKEKARLCGLHSQVFYICASASHLPFHEEVFNQVFLVDVIEHIHDDDKALIEACRTLREGGLLEISTPTPLYPRIFGYQMHKRIGHVRDGYLLNELIEKLKKCGFEIAYERQNTGYLTWPWIGFWYRINLNSARTFVGKLTYNLMLAFFSLIIRFVGLFDCFGGYCSNDVRARKKL